MKYENRKKKKPSRHNERTNNPKTSNGDTFFEPDRKRQRRRSNDEDLESLPSDEEEQIQDPDGDGKPMETAAEVKYRIASEQLEKIRAAAKRVEEEEEDDEEEGEGREKVEGKRDSLIADILQKRQLEESGRARRSIAARVLKPEPVDEFRLLMKHRQSVTCIALSEDDTRGFSACKDGTIVHWNVESGKTEKYVWPSEDVLISHHAKAPQTSSSKRSKVALALAVSSDGRYLASGGLDRHVHLWDTRTREHILAFHGHKGPVSCLTFRQGTAQLFSGSFDRQIKLWNAEDRTHMDTLHGHQSEIVSIDCLHKERILTAGRDRTIQIWKVADEKRLLYRSPSSAECCCFINDNEFLSGSDDGSIELWSVLRKKPSHILRNAHAPQLHSDGQSHNEEDIPNGSKGENGFNGAGSYSLAQSWVSSVAVCRSSDLAASGAGNGMVRLWGIESDDRSIKPLFTYPLVGYINSLAFAKSGRFLLAAVGQEPRLGRWGRIKNARNGVAILPIRLKEERGAHFLKD